MNSGTQRRRSVLLAAVAAVIAGSAIAASSASAILIKLHNGQVASYQPLRKAGPTSFDTAFKNLDYNGGAVMPSNRDYLIFWSPTGYSAYGTGTTPEYVSGIEQYWQDLAHDSGLRTNTDSVATQYNDAAGHVPAYKVSYGGAFLDTDPYPANGCPAATSVTHCLIDSQLQTELQKFAAANHLRRDLTHEFFLITPPHIEGCFSGNALANPPYGGCSAGFVPQTDALYCAYHQQTASSPILFYADDPYVTGNAGCDDGNHPNGPSDGALEGGMSHEHNESITDPIPNDTWTNGTGANHGMENGDQCDGQMGAALGTHNGASYNQVINGHFYWYQEEWSNDGHQCLQRYTPPTTLPRAKYTVTPGSGLAMTFDATGSFAPGGIADFSWQFNAVTNASTIEKTSPTETFTFPVAGTYSTGLTVYSHTGLSRGAGGLVTTGASGFTPGFSFSPAAPVHGTPVTFTGLSTISRLKVKNYLWEFGDGAAGSGQSPSHTYAAAGTYKVEVIEFSGVGSAYPGSGAAPVATATVTVS